MKLTPLFELHVDIGIPVSAGAGPYGRRVFYPIVSGWFRGAEEGGTFRGKPLRGTVVGGGGDWVLINDKATHLDIRLMLQTDDQRPWPIYLQAFGVLTVNAAVERRAQNPSLITEYEETYFMTQPRFETGDDTDATTGQLRTNPYKWLNDVVAIGQGKLGPSFPGYITAQWLETRSYLVQNS